MYYFVRAALMKSLVLLKEAMRIRKSINFLFRKQRLFQKQEHESITFAILFSNLGKHINKFKAFNR